MPRGIPNNQQKRKSCPLGCDVGPMLPAPWGKHMSTRHHDWFLAYKQAKSDNKTEPKSHHKITRKNGAVHAPTAEHVEATVAPITDVMNFHKCLTAARHKRTIIVEAIRRGQLDLEETDVDIKSLKEQFKRAARELNAEVESEEQVVHFDVQSMSAGPAYH